MAGIIFLKTGDLKAVEEFYCKGLDMELWIDQGTCKILKHDNLLLGFCKGEEPEREGVITFFYENKEKVDEMYGRLKDIAEAPPVENERYNIYHFYARDLEGRAIEFQTFLHELKPYSDGDSLLRERRSVRYYTDKKVARKTFIDLIELCRFAPTSKNSQSYYFVPIYEKELQEELASERGRSSEPIVRAPMAVAICSNPELSKRHVQDGCIAAYHFMLAAALYGLGTCWIADMDREIVKNMLKIPQEHYVVTVTPLGHPEEIPDTPKRKPAEYFIKER